MKLIGKIVANSYIIRELIEDNPFYSLWIASSIFYPAKVLIKIFSKRDKLISENEFKAVIDGKYIKSSLQNYVLQVLSKVEVENRDALIIKTLEGETLKNFFKKQKVQKEEYSRIFLNVSKIIATLNENGIYLKNFDSGSFWIDNTRKINLITIDSAICKKDFLLNQNKRVKRFLIQKKNSIDNEDIDKKNETILLALCFYSLLTADYEIKYIEKNKKNLIPTSYQPIINKAINRKFNYYVKDIVDDLNKISSSSFNLKTEKSSVSSGYTYSQSRGLEVNFEDRRAYFEALEQERRKKVELNRKEEENHFPDNKGMPSFDEYLKEYEKRKKYFEMFEKEKADFLDRLQNETKKNQNSMIEDSSSYFKNLLTENQDSLKVKDYFERIVSQMKEYTNYLKNENLKYLERLKESRETEKFKVEYLKERVKEIKDRVISSYSETKEFAHNLIQNSISQIGEFLINESKKADKNLKESFNKSDKELKEIENYYKEFLSTLKVTKEYNDSENFLEFERGIDIINQRKISLFRDIWLLRLLRYFILTLTFRIKYCYKKIKNIFKGVK